jgi:hypothetical protein
MGPNGAVHCAGCDHLCPNGARNAAEAVTKPAAVGSITMREARLRFRSLAGAIVFAASALVMLGCGSVTEAPVASTSSPASSPAADAAAAGTAALTIFYALPGQSPEIWVPCSQRAAGFAMCPFSPEVKARLDELSAMGFGGDVPPGCAEDYITGTQNGLFAAPHVVTAIAGADGSVTVVIHRGSPPDFTATMKLVNGAWVATDLASGSGPSASIFSTKPNC